MLYGGKGSQLLKLKAAGFPTPSFVCIDAVTLQTLFFSNNSALQLMLEEGLTRFKSLEDLDADWCLAIEQQIFNARLCEQTWEAIQQLLTSLFEENTYVSVRSSALDEDGESFSFAGQHHTELYVEFAALLGAIRKGMASVWSYSALSYRLIHKLPMPKLGLALVIQKMVHAQRSGIGFSMNTAGNYADAVLSVGYGIGEGIVSGLSDTDTYLKSRTSERVRFLIQKKELLLNWSKEKGVFEDKVAPDKMYDSCISKEECRMVFDWLTKAEALLQRPVDMEFVIDEQGQIWILQIRPITSIQLNKLEILDNTNIVESYPGISLPLSFSFASNAYERLFKESAVRFKLTKSELDSLNTVFPNLIAHYYGRIYYRLDNWYRMTALVYQSSRSLKAWETAVGLPDSAANKFRFTFWGKLRMFYSVSHLILFYKSNNRKFFHSFTSNYSFYKKYENTQSLDFDKAWTHLTEAMDRTFKPWPQTIVNDFLAFHLYGWLQRWVQKWGISTEDEFANELISGFGVVESEQAVAALLDLKDTVVNSPLLFDLFSQETSVILDAIQRDVFPDFTQSWNKYLALYGDRTLEELKLETITPRIDPSLLVALIRSQLSSNLSAKSFEEGRALVHKKAWDKVTKKLSFPRKFLFKRLASLAAYGVMSRENMRFCRTRIFAASRSLFLAMGHDLVQRGGLVNPRDIFYLEFSELHSFFQKELSLLALKETVEERKKTYAGFVGLHLADRVIYAEGKTPTHQEESRNSSDNQSDKEDVFIGIPVSGGQVEGEAIVITEPTFTIDVRNKILVSRMTDPGWVFLMSQAAALVTEKGSLLSHTAIVGRELGIPVVVGIEGITQLIKSGDRLRVDGSKGVVEKC
jgi:phosphohistidine swiveling domain-containing protein